MSKKELLKRYILLIIGLFIMAMGISLMVKAKLGTSPISSVPYVVSLKLTSISLGTFTFIWNMILIISQIFILGKKFTKIQFVQVPVSVLFGMFVDLAKYMIRDLDPQTYLGSVIILVLGCFTLALGVSCTVLADVIMNSGEAFVKAITIKTGRDFGNTKVMFDVSLVILSVVLSVIFFHKIVGVREGTIFAAVVSGFIIKILNNKLRFIVDNFIEDEEEAIY